MASTSVMESSSSQGGTQAVLNNFFAGDTALTDESHRIAEERLGQAGRRLDRGGHFAAFVSRRSPIL